MNSFGDQKRRKKKIITGGENYFWQRKHNSVHCRLAIKFHRFYFILLVVHRICCCSANICPSRPPPPIGETGPHGQNQCESVSPSSSPQILLLNLMVLFPYPQASSIPFLLSSPIPEGQPRRFFSGARSIPFPFISHSILFRHKQLKNLFH